MHALCKLKNIEEKKNNFSVCLNMNILLILISMFMTTCHYYSYYIQSFPVFSFYTYIISTLGHTKILQLLNFKRNLSLLLEVIIECRFEHKISKNNGEHIGEYIKA